MNDVEIGDLVKITKIYEGIRSITIQDYSIELNIDSPYANSINNIGIVVALVHPVRLRAGSEVVYVLFRDHVLWFLYDEVMKI